MCPFGAKPEWAERSAAAPRPALIQRGIMYSDELFNRQKEWSSKALVLMRELLPLMAPIAKYPEWTKEEQRTLGLIVTACARSSESVLLLCAYGQLWDAEVVGRSVFEGTLKFAYLLQTAQDFKQRHQEYCHDLLQIGLLRDHQKAADLLG